MVERGLPTMYELCLLHARADRALRSVVTRQLDSQQLTMMEWLALGSIVEAPKEGLSMSQIAAVLNVTLPQVTALVSNLTKAKVVRQKVLVSDRRGRQVQATAKGQRVMLRLEDTIADAVREWTQDIPPDELTQYIEVVKQLADKGNQK